MKYFNFIVVILIFFNITILNAKIKVDLSITDVKETTVLGVRDTIIGDMSKISEKIAVDYQEISNFVEQNKIRVTGYPIVINVSWTDKIYNFISAFPIDKKKNYKLSGRLLFFGLPETKAVKAKVVGSYEESEVAYKKIFEYIKKKGFIQSQISWEEYINDPASVTPDKIEYNIYVPIKEKEKGK